MHQHSDFVHLHVHTEYSLLDGEIKISRLVEQAKNLHMPALAITDHGNMFGAINFYTAAVKAGIKPIIGCEVYVAPGNRLDKDKHKHKDVSYHLTLLAMDETGYKNLMQLSTIGYLEGFYYKPRVDKEVLSKYGKGLIALSGCLKGELSLYSLKGEIKQAREVVKQYQDIFGPENFYIEIQSNSIPDQQIINKQLVLMGKEMNIPLVATSDCHYLSQEEARAHDILLCLQTGTTLDTKDRMKFSTDEFYFRSGEEMKKIFADVPEAISNTIKIAERCNVELKFDQIIMPHYQVPSGFTLETYLSNLCEEGLKKRFKDITPEIKDRMEYELKIINKMGYAGYFLIVWDVINYGRINGIPVGPGRGSAAGSLVAYVLEITNINPLKYGLLFERFLNPDRVSMPDIDMDFCYKRRQEVIEYVGKKYGKDRVAQIITFGTMAARVSIRDVGRVLGLPLAEVDKIAKLIPAELNITLSKAIESEPELQKLIDEKKEIAELFSQAQILEGITRHASTHAAGIVISREPLINYCPLYEGSKHEVTTQYDMDSIAKIGLLKMDFLGLMTLTVMNDALNIIKRTCGVAPDLDNISLDDEKTYKLITAGQTIGVFQLESTGMRDILRKIKPNKFEDIIAVLALYRPGPLGSGMVDDFVERKHGIRENKPLHPKIENILKDTYGVILYQEQVMQIANVLSGFTMGQADFLRKAMGKKIPEVMEEQRKHFVEGAASNHVKKETAEYIFDLIAKFAGYGFNKSHSAAYALISYETAYLKANYPTEFMAAVLTSEMGNIKEVVFYIKECEKMGIKILPPDVNDSFHKFTVITDKTIRFGLAAIKNVGGGAIDSIIKAREEHGYFKSINKFCELVDTRLVNRRVVESLIKCGAFDSLGFKRAQLEKGLDQSMEMAFQIQNDRSRGQTSLFVDSEKENNFESQYQELPQTEEWPENVLLAGEKETLGLYLTGHPLAKYEKEIKTYSNVSTISIVNKEDGQEITIAGIISNISLKSTKKGDRMAILTLEDLKGTIEVILFPEKYRTNTAHIREDAIIFVKGRVDTTGENPKIIGNEIIPVEEIKKQIISRFHIKLNTVGLEESDLIDMKNLIVKNKGKCAVYMHFFDTHGKETIVRSASNYLVNPTDNFISAMEKLVGEENIWFSD